MFAVLRSGPAVETWGAAGIQCTENVSKAARARQGRIREREGMSLSQGGSDRSPATSLHEDSRGRIGSGLGERHKHSDLGVLSNTMASRSTTSRLLYPLPIWVTRNLLVRTPPSARPIYTSVVMMVISTRRPPVDINLQLKPSLFPLNSSVSPLPLAEPARFKRMISDEISQREIHDAPPRG